MNLRFHFATMMAALAVGWGASVRADVIQVTDFTPNAAASPGEWGISDVRPGASATIVDLTGLGGNLENSQPLAPGAALLTLDNTNTAKAEVGIYHDYGSFAGIAANIQLSYDFYKDSSGTSIDPAPSMKIGLFNGTKLGYLIYEPYTNPAFNQPTKDVWTSESMNATKGGWWWSGAFGPGSSFGGPPYNTLSQWSSILTGAEMVYVGMGMGSSNPNSVGYFDNVHIQAGDSNHTYDFGPQTAPEPSSLALLALGGFGLIAGRRRKTKV